MTTGTLPRVPAARSGLKVTNRRVLRSEWSKFWSLRSSRITLALSVVVLIVFGVIASAVYKTPTAASPGDGDDAVSLALTGVSVAGLVFGVLGVLMTAGEYGTGMARSTFAAVPRRWPVLFAKCVVIGLLVFVLMTISALITFQISAATLHGKPIALTLADHGVLRSLVGAGVYLALFALFGVALGSLLRSTPGGIGALVGFLLLLPGLAALLSESTRNRVEPYFPGNAGDSIYALHRAANSLSPGAGLAVFAGWVAVLLAAAAFRLKRSDV
jgi:ABC-2 type transport system permease protein